MRAVLVLILGAAGARLRLNSYGNPVSRVAALLTNLQDKVKRDGEAEQEVYDQYKCWCKKTLNAKAQTMEANRLRIAELAAYIDDLESGRIELTSERSTNEAEVKELEHAIEEATTLRNAAREEYLAAKKELEQGIAGLSSALTTLQNATEDAQEGVFASVKTELAKVVNVGNRFLSKKEIDEALKSIQAPGGADWEKLNSDPTFAMKYKARSGEIQNVLSDMKDAFEANLNNTEAVETKAVADFDALMGAKNGQLDTAKNALLDKAEETGARATALSDSKEEKTDKEEQNTRDEGFVQETHTACDTKADEWAARTKLRNEEIIAISEAIQIIHSDDARDLMKKSFDKVTPSAFIQVAKEHHGSVASALKILQKDARGNPRILAVVARIATLSQKTQKKKKSDPFQAVIDEVNDMITDLTDEETADHAEKVQCETDQKSNTQSAKTDSKSIDANTAEIDRLNAKIEKAEEGIASNKQQIDDLEQAKVEATDQREKEAKDYAQAKLDDQGAIDLLETSMQVLKDFYSEKGLSLGLVQKGRSAHRQEPFVAAGEAPEEAPATWDSEYGGASGETAGIIGLMEEIKTDLETDITNSDAAETGAISTYDTLMSDMEASIDGLKTATGTLEGEVAADEKTVGDEEGHRDATSEDLNATMSLLESIREQCDYVRSGYAARKYDRDTEREALETALADLEASRPK
jgi:soluble cytochrome b562